MLHVCMYNVVSIMISSSSIVMFIVIILCIYIYIERERRPNLSRLNTLQRPH